MKFNERQQDFLSDKLGDFGNLIGTGVVVLAAVAEKVGWFSIVGALIVCLTLYLVALYLRR